MISPGDDIADIIIHNLKTNKISIHNGDILTIAQKLYLNLKIDIVN